MRHPGYGVLNWFIRVAVDGGVITIYGDGKQLRDYMYVEDAVSALLEIGARSDLVGEVVNVGSGKGMPFLDFVKAVITAVGQGEYQLAPWPEDASKLDVGDFVLDTTKLNHLTGWEPTVSLADGLERTVAFYRAYREHYWSD